MGDMKIKIDNLNQIVAIIDQKASAYKNDRHHMPKARAVAEKKLIFDLISEANNLASIILPKPTGLIEDLGRLKKTL